MFEKNKTKNSPFEENPGRMWLPGYRWATTHWGPGAVFAQPLLPKGLSLQVEIQSVCLSFCHSVIASIFPIYGLQIIPPLPPVVPFAPFAPFAPFVWQQKLIPQHISYLKYCREEIYKFPDIWLTEKKMWLGGSRRATAHWGASCLYFCVSTKFLSDISQHMSYHMTKVSVQKKNTGLFGNFSQTSDPPPPPLLGTLRSRWNFLGDFVKNLVCFLGDFGVI